MIAPGDAKEAARWLTYAEDDLRLAQAILAMTNVKPGQACYHSQQAGEKALKAVLIIAGVPVPRTHDLTELGKLVPVGWRSAGLPRIDLSTLTRWAIEARYPDVVGAVEATAADADDAVRLAGGVMNAAKDDLQDPH